MKKNQRTSAADERLAGVDVLLTLDDVAAIFRLSPATIRSKLQNGTFHPQPVRKYPYRWRKVDVERDLAMHIDKRRAKHGFASGKSRPAKALPPVEAAAVPVKLDDESKNMNEPFIVAEISKNWIAGRSASQLLLAQQFEIAINHNAARGYRLFSFELHRLIVAPDAMNETIIAVFERLPIAQQ